jgi:hypothetical protein
MPFQYKPNSTCKHTGRNRAKKLYPILGKCELCDKDATDRHHKDGNTFHNSEDNVVFLCRHHHMSEDGRLAQLLINGVRPKLMTPKMCINCGVMAYPLRKGRCHACNEYYRRNEIDRNIRFDHKGEQKQLCPNCNMWFTKTTHHKIYCDTCTLYLHRLEHKLYERERRKRIKNSEAHNILEVKE